MTKRGGKKARNEERISVDKFLSDGLRLNQRMAIKACLLACLLACAKIFPRLATSFSKRVYFLGTHAVALGRGSERGAECPVDLPLLIPPVFSDNPEPEPGPFGDFFPKSSVVSGSLKMVM